MHHQDWQNCFLDGTNLIYHYITGWVSSEALSQYGHKLNTDPEITGLRFDVHSLSQEVNATVTPLQDIRDATEKILQDIIQFTCRLV